MALFKINKGNSANLGVTEQTQYAKEGFAYFTPDNGKFYVDIAGETDPQKPQTAAELFKNRIPLSADKTDRIHTIDSTAQNDATHTYEVICEDIVTLSTGVILAVTISQHSLGEDFLKLNGFTQYPILLQGNVVKPNELQPGQLVFMIYNKNEQVWNCISNSGAQTNVYYAIADNWSGVSTSDGNASFDSINNALHVTIPNYTEQNGNIFYVNPVHSSWGLKGTKFIINGEYEYNIDPGYSHPDVSKTFTIPQGSAARFTLRNRVLIFDGYSEAFADKVQQVFFYYDEDTLQEVNSVFVQCQGQVDTDYSPMYFAYNLLTQVGTGVAAPALVMPTGGDLMSAQQLTLSGMMTLPFDNGNDVPVIFWSGSMMLPIDDGLYTVNMHLLVPITEAAEVLGIFVADFSSCATISEVSVTDKTITFLGIFGQELQSIEVPDYRVRQEKANENANYPILLAPKNQNVSSAIETTAFYDSGIYVNPVTNTITAPRFIGVATAAEDAGGINTTWIGTDSHNIHSIDSYFETPNTTDKCANYIVEHGSYYNKPLAVDFFFNGNQMGEPEDDGGPKGHVYLGAADSVGSYVQADELRGSLDWSYIYGAPSPGNGKITINAGTGIKIGTGTSGSFQLNQTGNDTITINHANSITNGNFGDSANTRKLSFGGTFNIPYVEYDSNGHITSASTITLTMPANPNTNTTYTVSTGDSNGQIKVDPSNADAYNVTVKGLGSAAFTDSSAYAPASHGTHLTLGTSSTNAFRGDYGNTAYTHSQSAHAPTNAQKNSDITKTEIEAKLIGDITSHTHSAYAAASHGNHVPATQTADNTKFLRNDNTWATVTPANIGAAPASHGNHVPTTQAADNAKFLRNDNTWATVTPANIGAAPASHGTHLSLGTTSSTAFRGDYGNTAYTHSQSTHAPTNAQKNSDITKAEIEAKLTGDITSHTHSAYAAASHGTHVTAATVKSALGTGTGTTKFLREDGTWVKPSYYTLSKAKVEAVLTGAITSHTHSYLPLAGGTVTGVITSTYASGTWQTSATSSAITINHSTYGGWICGPAKNGRLVISSYPGSDNTLYFGYYASTSTTNAFTKSMTWDGATGTLTATSVYGAVWNDYAEFRTTKEEIEAGRVVVENGDDTLSLATDRLMPGANIVSDTFGFAIGKTEKSKTPLAVSGRVLAYPYEDRNSYKPGDPVCSGPNGTVSKMTREEVMMYPDRIIGTVSAIPTYKTWGTGNVEVNNRIWIKI